MKVNSTWEQLGFTEEELFEKNILDLVHPDDKEKTSNEFEHLDHGQTTKNFQNRIIKKDGSIIHLLWSAQTDPETRVIYGTAIDITERIKKENIQKAISDIRSLFLKEYFDKQLMFKDILNYALKLTSSEYGFIGEVLYKKEDNSPYLKTLFLTDISWNEETKSLYENTSKNGFIFDNLNTLFGEVLQTGKKLITNTPQTHPKRGGLPVGHPPLRNFAGLPIFYKGSMTAMIGIANANFGFNDSEMDYLNPFLDVIGEMINHFKLTEELEKQKLITNHTTKLASIGELAAGIGHEINNPLAIIKGQIEITKNNLMLNNQLSVDIETRYLKIIKSIERISHILQGLRNFSRATETEMEVFDFNQLASETVDMMKDLYHGEQIEFQISIKSQIWVLANRGKLQQALVNLITNAKDALHNVENKKISIFANNSNSIFILKVKDNGCGIAKGLHSKIFDAFYTTKEVNKGTGLGLSLIYNICKDHHGHISVNSDVGLGAEFILELPIIASIDQKTKFVNKNSIKFSIGKKLNVLIVDDEVDLREILSDYLKDLNCNVESAENGEEALSLLKDKNNSFDLIISDIKMPNLNGIELFKEIQKLNINIPFVYSTGGVNNDLSDVKNLYLEILEKPYNVDSLAKILNKIRDK